MIYFMLISDAARTPSPFGEGRGEAYQSNL